MVCKYCGYTLADDSEDQVCPKCGKSLLEDASDVVDLREVTDEADSEVEEEDYYEDELDDDMSLEDKPAKKSKAGVIIAACAGVVLIACLAVVFVFGFGKKKDTDGSHKIGDYSSYEQYITKLGNYKGVEVSMKVDEVTDEQLDAYIVKLLNNMATQEEVKNRTDVQEGDIANIDFTGYLDGVEFEGGKATGFDLGIGSGQFVPGFEEQLIGVKVGETKDIEVTFPEVYQNNPDLAGKPVVFKVKVNSIKETKVPELTDEWVAANSDVKTVNEYKEVVREQMKKNAYNKLVSNQPFTILDTIYSETEFASYPEEIVENYKGYMLSQYEYIAQMQGVSLEDMINASGTTNMEEFNKTIEEAAKISAGNDVLCFVIAHKEGIKLSDEEYQDEAFKYAKAKQYDSLEQLEAELGKERIYDYLVRQRVLKLLVENCVEVTE